MTDTDWENEYDLPLYTDLYRVYGEDGRLLYVGVSADWRERMKQHARTAPWFSSAAQLVIQTFTSRELAQTAEREAIKSEWPLWNRAGSPRPILADHLHYSARAEQRERSLDDHFARCRANDERLWDLINRRIKYLVLLPSQQDVDCADRAA